MATTVELVKPYINCITGTGLTKDNTTLVYNGVNLTNLCCNGTKLLFYYSPTEVVTSLPQVSLDFSQLIGEVGSIVRLKGNNLQQIGTINNPTFNNVIYIKDTNIIYPVVISWADFDFSTDMTLNTTTNYFEITSLPIVIPVGLTSGSIYDMYIKTYTNPTGIIQSLYLKVSCYNEGTQILCMVNDKETYIPIEQMVKGTIVKTYKDGYRKVDLIGKKKMMNDPAKWHGCMYLLPKNEMMTDDLIITGAHSILLDELTKEEDKLRIMALGYEKKIHDKQLLPAAACKQFIKQTEIKEYTYYHFTIEEEEEEEEGKCDTQYGVWANGILSETTFKNDFLKHGYTIL